MDSEKFMLYSNQKYGFSLKIPSWWKKHCFLSTGHSLESAEYSLNFNLRYTKPIKGKKSCVVFRIVVYNMSSEEWMEKYEDSPVGFIDEREGKVFAILIPEEPPEEFYNHKTGEYNRNLQEFKWLVHMERAEVDSIRRSFKFVGH